MDISPPLLNQLELQGASHTTGGIFRGRVYGNNLNIGDFADEDDNLISIMGKIYLYITADDPVTWDISIKKCSIVIKHSVTSSLATILNEIGGRHSPMQSKYRLLIIISILIFI